MSSEESRSQLDEDSDILSLDSEETLPLNNNPELDNASKAAHGMFPRNPHNLLQPHHRPNNNGFKYGKTRVDVNLDGTGQVCFRNEEEWNYRVLYHINYVLLVGDQR